MVYFVKRLAFIKKYLFLGKNCYIHLKIIDKISNYLYNDYKIQKMLKSTYLKALSELNNKKGE